jgi:hypothetical protein
MRIALRDEAILRFDEELIFFPLLLLFSRKTAD